MILGDGNLSFSYAFASLNTHLLIVASVIEPNITEFLLRYPSGYETLQKIHNHCPNVLSVKFGVDATCLENFLLKFGRNLIHFTDIIMNFPHPGGKTNLAANRRLLSGIFSSISNLQFNYKFRFYLTLANGQSGLENSPEEIFSSYLPAHKADSWQAAYLAANFHFRLFKRRLFFPENFPDYRCAGYLNRDQHFHNKICSDILIFEKAQDISVFYAFPDMILFNLKNYEEFWEKLKPNVLEFFGCFSTLRVFHCLRPYFMHDISILFEFPSKDISPWKVIRRIDQLERRILIPIVGYLTGNLLVDFFEVFNLRGFCPRTGRPNRIYRMVWQGWTVIFNKSLCNLIQENFRKRLQNNFNLLSDENNRLFLN